MHFGLARPSVYVCMYVVYMYVCTYNFIISISRRFEGEADDDAIFVCRYYVSCDAMYVCMYVLCWAGGRMMMMMIDW